MNRALSYFLLLLLVVVAVGCSSPYQIAASKHPTTFSIHRDSIPTAWARAQQWFATGSAKPIPVTLVTDALIQAGSATPGSTLYTISRLPVGDSVRIEVKGKYNPTAPSDQTPQLYVDFDMAQLAFFIHTGYTRTNYPQQR